MYTFKSPLVACFFFISVASCKKQAPVCTRNFNPINSHGIVVNKLTTTGVSGVPVSLSWVKFVGGFSQSEIIATVNSKTDGTFNFTPSIDTSYFNKGYFLSLSVSSNNEYIILGNSGVIESRTYSFNQNAFQGIQLEVFRKANLQIKLHRTQNDNFQSFSISHSNIVDNDFFYDYNVQSPQEVIDRNQSTLTIKTVADVFTKIRVIKSFFNGTLSSTLDSVRCNINSTEVYDVNF